MHLSEELLPWDLLIRVAVVGPFLAALLGAAGADAWKTLRQLVDELSEARRVSGRSDGRVEIHADDGTRVEFPARLPDEAYQTLAELRIHPGRWYVWESKKKAWREIDPRA